MAAATAAGAGAPGAAGLPDTAAGPVGDEERLTVEEMGLYGRQMLVGGVGPRAQFRLRHARVLVVGCGGLGCPAAVYLAGSGVGHLTLVDDDRVDVSNLHRQVAHSRERVGMNKAASLAVACRALNPAVAVTVVEERLSATADGLALVRGHSVVLDCTDNPGSRYIVSDACVLAGVPLVSAAALGADAQLTVYHAASDSPCYRCLHPEPPPAALAGSCADNGVLGPVTGMAGSLQALEAIKVLTGWGQPLNRRLLVVDGQDARVRVVKLRGRRADCAVCGDTPTITALEDTAAFCRAHGVALAEGCALTPGAAGSACGGSGSGGPGAPPASWREVAAGELAALLGLTPARSPDPYLPLAREIHAIAASSDDDCMCRLRETVREVAGAAGGTGVLVLDVRVAEQFALCRLPGSVHFPLKALRRRVAEVAEVLRSAGVGTVTLCRRGVLSREAAAVLADAGVEGVSNATGGLAAFSASVDSAMPQY